MHRYDTSKLLATPDDDIELVSNYFNDKCNCYSYAVHEDGINFAGMTYPKKIPPIF